MRMFAVLTGVSMVMRSAPMRVRMSVLMPVGMAVSGTAMRVFMRMRMAMRVRAFHIAS